MDTVIKSKESENDKTKSKALKHMNNANVIQMQLGIDRYIKEASSKPT